MSSSDVIGKTVHFVSSSGSHHLATIAEILSEDGDARLEGVPVKPIKDELGNVVKYEPPLDKGVHPEMVDMPSRVRYAPVGGEHGVCTPYTWHWPETPKLKADAPSA